MDSVAHDIFFTGTSVMDGASNELVRRSVLTTDSSLRIGSRFLPSYCGMLQVMSRVLDLGNLRSPKPHQKGLFLHLFQGSHPRVRLGLTEGPDLHKGVNATEESALWCRRRGLRMGGGGPSLVTLIVQIRVTNLYCASIIPYILEGSSLLSCLTIDTFHQQAARMNSRGLL